MGFFYGQKAADREQYHHEGHLSDLGVVSAEPPDVALQYSDPSETIEYNFAQIMDKELTIKSVFRYRNIYPRAIAAVASGAIDVKGIVTHTFDLDHIQEAYQEAVNNKTDLVKAVIRIQ